MDENPYQSPQVGEQPPARQSLGALPRFVWAAIGFIVGVMVSSSVLHEKYFVSKSPLLVGVLLVGVLGALLGWLIRSRRS
jgi:hypothetical protein